MIFGVCGVPVYLPGHAIHTHNTHVYIYIHTHIYTYKTIYIIQFVNIFGFGRAHHYGQQGKECLEAYLYYGKTLLEIARMENGVLGHAIKEGKYYEVDARLDCISVKYSTKSVGFDLSF